MPYPLPLTRTEAYLAYKAGVIQQSDLKPSLAIPRNGIDAWLAYWTGLAADYPKREDGTPHILQEEEAYIAYLCGVINEYPEKCLRRVGAYLRYLISARWGRPDHPLNREELYLSLLKTQFIPSGDPSSDITIDGTAKAAFVDVKMYGDTAQQTYTGKNLINPIAISGTSKGITYSFDQATNEITLNGTATDKSACYFSNDNRISLDGEYTLSYEKVSGSITPSGTCRIEIAASSWGSNTIYLSLQDSSASITATKTFDVYAVDFNIGQGTVCNNFKIKLQLEKSASATSFEPYVGGQASPNPDFPQPIQTVTGRQMVKVEGKNLNRFPYVSGSSRTHRGVTFTANSDGSVTIKGTHDGSGTAIYCFRDFWAYNETDGVVVDANTTITASITGGAEYGIRFIAEGYHSDATYDQLNTTSTQTITTTAKATFNGRITVYAGFSSEEGVTVYPMLEKGSTATTYETYSSNDYEINLGKNLFDPSNYTTVHRYPRDDMSIANNQNAWSIVVPIDGNTTYTISTTNRGLMDQYAAAGITTEDPATATGIVAYASMGGGATSSTLTSPANGKFLMIYVKWSSTNATQAIANTIQIEKGSEATEFVPYFTPIELCKFGTYQDYIWKDGDDWKVHKATATITLTGASSENWYIDQYAYMLNNVISAKAFSDIANMEAYCRSFSKSATGQTSSYAVSFWYNAPGTSVRFIKDQTPDLSSFRNWLASNNQTVYYPLATATDTTITDTNLIAQLEALVSGGAENGTTYIKVNATDPNLPGLLYVEAPKYE